MEIHVIDAHNAPVYAKFMEMNYRCRSQIFVDELGWRALRSVDGSEKDQFDNNDAIHFLAIDQGVIAGGARLHPASCPTLLSTVFSHLAPDGFDQGSDIYEGTRVYVMPRWRTEKPTKMSGLLHWAVWAEALRRGARQINLVTHAAFVPHLMRMGLSPRPLGLPDEHEGQMLMAVSTAVNEDVLVNILTYYDINPVPIIRTGASQTFAGVA